MTRKGSNTCTNLYWNRVEAVSVFHLVACFCNTYEMEQSVYRIKIIKQNQELSKIKVTFWFRFAFARGKPDGMSL